jgi:hypothetical protein
MYHFLCTQIYAAIFFVLLQDTQLPGLTGNQYIDSGLRFPLLLFLIKPCAGRHANPQLAGKIIG